MLSRTPSRAGFLPRAPQAQSRGITTDPSSWPPILRNEPIPRTLPKTSSLDTPETRVKAIAPGFFVGEQNRALLLNEDGSVTACGKTIIDHTSAGRFGEPDNLINT